MEELRKFEFGTIVCDGCARRIDSNVNEEVLYDVEDLLGGELEYREWEEQSDGKWYCPECAKDPKHRIHPGEGRIIVDRMTLSGLRCDCCGHEFENYEGFSCWEDFSDTEDKARDDGWNDVDGKMLCPDCWKTCAAIEDVEEDNYEEVYCSKCPYKDDCNEIVPSDGPTPSDRCRYACRNGDGKWEKCPHLSHLAEGIKTIHGCNLPKGEKCPHVLQWEKDKVEVERKNREIEDWVKHKTD